MDRYDERFRTHRIEKIRPIEASEDFDSVHYVHDRDLDEHSTKLAFTLDTVQSWEHYDDPFNKFKYKGPMTVLDIYAGDRVIIQEDFEYFDRVMTDFINKQQAYYEQTHSKGTKN